MNKIIYILIFFSLSRESVGQKENRIWYFGGGCSTSGGGAGLDFNSGSPVVLLNSIMPKTEGSAVQSDRNGQLLFYSDGVNIYDRTHTLMFNGANIGGHVSSVQPAVIIPFTNDSTKFYVFAQDGIPSGTGTGLHYSVVDMSLNGGLGGVTATKAVLIQSGTSEALTATKHLNGIDYWVTALDFDSTIFYSHKVSSTGISPPVKTNLGFNTSTQANMRFNNKGDKVTFLIGGSFVRHLFDFNLASGAISNAIPIDTNAVTDGAEFSPNDSLLYSQSNFGPISYVLHQYQVFSGNIYSSRQVVATSSYFADFLDLKLAPDGKIYVNKDCADSLDVINFPNTIGVSCNYQKNVLWLGGRKHYCYFPNEIFELPKYPLSILELSNSETVIYPNPVEDLIYLKITNSVTKVSINNLQGQNVLTKTNLDSYKIDVSDIPDGIYFAEIISGENNYREKIIVRH
jgi:hypothetical protein